MNENKLSPELQRIFDEYSVEFWNRLCECRECDIEEAIGIFRDAFVEVNEIMKEVKQKQLSEEEVKFLRMSKQASDEEVKNLRMKYIKDEIMVFKVICGEVSNDN